MNRRKQRLMCALALLLAIGGLPHAQAETGRMVSPWAADGVRAAYESGAVSASADLGMDYTLPISRAQIVRLWVDLIAHERQTSLDDLLLQYNVAVEPSDPAIPEDAPPPQPLEDAPSDDPPLPAGEETAAEGLADIGMPPEAQAPTEPWPEELPRVVDGSFTDTQSAYIELAARMGIVKGAQGKFCPDDPVSRAEAAAMMQRCMGLLGHGEANRPPQQFTDAYDIPRWAVEAVKYVSGRTDPEGRALMEGTDGKFLPQAPYTVEQAILSAGRMQASQTIAEVAADWRAAPGYDTVTLALTFGGDCTFGRGRDFSYQGSFDEMYDLKGPAYFFSDVTAFFDDDLTMVNFEGTLTESSRYANKTFVFKGRPAYAEILQKGSIDLVTIANNHSKDYLQQGFDDTIRHLSPYVQVSGYERMPIVTVKGIRIGFVSNVGWAFDAGQKRFINNAIQSLREQGADLIVFNYHWGTERAYRSNATQRAIGRYCIDQGADLVIGHHPHVVQEVETYKGKQIAYSLGNLVFGGNRNPSDKNCLIFRQNFTLNLDSRQITDTSYRAIPYRISSVTWRNDYHPVEVQSK